jgi:hypothetical protein
MRLWAGGVVKRSHENASEKVLCVAAGVAVDLALAGWLAQAFIAASLLEMLRSPAAAAAAACLHCIRLLLLAGWLACVWRSDTGDVARRRHSLSPRQRERLPALASSLAAAADIRVRALSSSLLWRRPKLQPERRSVGGLAALRARAPPLHQQPCRSDHRSCAREA